ncbi:MAG: DUF1997 domain-containing protein [Chloroflexaceae bacterium]|nr:DUF1997 domain-containing protein [Chloroflexaceae bacterium]
MPPETFPAAELTEAESESSVSSEPACFQTAFVGDMLMYSDGVTVSSYLDAHEGWFCRCAEPMAVEPLGDNGYTLTVGRFAALGYEVEPKLSVVLHPAKEGVYWMNSVPVPDYTAPGYEVDYQSVMELQELAAEALLPQKARSDKNLPEIVTQITWRLDLTVAVQFPKFIYRLPQSLIQTTGDRLLGQIVRQVSPRLTYKVQKDFHSRFNLPLPPKHTCNLQRVS